MSTLVVLREAAQKIVNLVSSNLGENRPRPPLRVRSQNAAAHQHIFAHREADTRLLLVTDKRKVHIKKVMRSLAPSGRGMPDQVHQHVRKTITRHGAVSPALHFEVQKYSPVATENGDVAHRTLALVGAQGRYFIQAGPIFMLEHGARGILRNDAANDCGSHYNAKS